jgi:hypothetical protein
MAVLGEHGALTGPVDAGTYTVLARFRVTSALLLTGVSLKSYGGGDITFGARLYSTAGALLASSGSPVLRSGASGWTGEAAFTTPYELAADTDYHAGYYGGTGGGYYSNASAHDHSGGGLTVTLPAAADRWRQVADDAWPTGVLVDWVELALGLYLEEVPAPGMASVTNVRVRSGGVFAAKARKVKVGGSFVEVG